MSTSARGPASAVLASFLGWMLDAFDFFLVVFCLTAIGREFGKTDAEMSLTIWMTLAFRPVGAFLFGLLADRYGRRLPLMIDLIFYSLVEVITGFAPNFTVFLVLRALFGIGMGGEWGVGASLAMEKVAPKWRGVISGLLQQGYAAGYLLASVCFFFFFNRWGWRPLFILGGAPALLAFYVRTHVGESEVWEAGPRHNLPALWRTLRSHAGIFLYLATLMTMMNFASHGTQDMYPTLLKRQWGFGAERISIVVAVSMIGALVGGVLVGLLSDRVGRRLAISGSLVCALLTIPLWAFAPSTIWLAAGAFLMQFFVQGAWGVIPAHLTELSPASVRGLLPGFAYQCGALISGSAVFFEASIAKHTSYSGAMAITAAVVFAGGIVAAALGRERKGSDFILEHV